MAATSAQTRQWIATAEASERHGWTRRLTQLWVVRFVISVVVWLFVGWVFALPNLMKDDYSQTLRMFLADFGTWALIAPLVVALDRRLPFSGKEAGRRVAAHLIASVPLTVLYFAVFTTVRALVGVVPWSSTRPAQLFALSNLGWYLWSWLIYCMIVGAVQSYGYYQRYVNSELRLERLEHSFAEARLNALRMQLDPHFLFNALNTISSHVERDPKLTRRMIEHLGDLLRLSLDSKDKQEVPLVEELAFLDHYLAIQKIRFGAQLRVDMQIAPEVRFASVPSLFLQPLVENAIRHGISRRAAGGRIIVQAAPVDGRLEVRVLDDGVGLPAGWSMETSAGLGLSITRERIAGLHPNGETRFAVCNREEGGTEVEISLPLRVTGEEANGHAVA